MAREVAPPVLLCLAAEGEIGMQILHSSGHIVAPSNKRARSRVQFANEPEIVQDFFRERPVPAPRPKPVEVTLFYRHRGSVI